ncbi:MAG: DUF4169 family protein [Rhodobacteraceae bacterium]|nr:DUF4169 family protein [Paracoccaceae bacterium]
MSGKVINLRQFRKQAARDEKRAKANANAASHGRTKGERDLQDARDAKAEKHLDQHRLDRDEE